MRFNASPLEYLFYRFGIYSFKARFMTNLCTSWIDCESNEKLGFFFNLLGTCAGYFCFKKIEFVALAIKISSYIIFELRQNSMHFMKKSHR